MTYSEATAFLNRFSKSGTPQTDLSRFRRLCGRLGDPQERLRFLHVAGTNGKGSVCAYLDEALRAAGIRTGCFTSPYIVDLRERIRLNGENISEEDFASCMARVREAVDCADFSQFELLTAAAFLFYDRARCAAVVLETGLGGLYDCTALVNPSVSVIAKIDFDHLAILGKTIPEIAAHKAGIIKPNVPAVIAPNQRAEALAVLKKRAEECGAPFIEADGARLSIQKNTLRKTEFLYRGKLFCTRMGGVHQPENAAAAIEALRCLKLPAEAIERGIASARLPARMQVFSEEPLIVIDGGHNESGAAAAAALLNAEGLRPIMLLGMLKTKEWEKALPRLLSAASSVVFTDSFSPDAVPAARLAAFAKERGIPSRAVSDADEALCAALAAQTDGGVFVGGSLYLAGRAIERLESRSFDMPKRSEMFGSQAPQHFI